MTRRELLVDTALALLVLGVTLAVLQGGGFGTASPGLRPLDPLGVALAVLSALPLAARRAAPLTAYALTAVGSLALDFLAYPLDIPFGPLVAVYSVADSYGGHPEPLRRWAAQLSVAGYVPATMAGYALGGNAVGGIVAEMLFWASMFAGIWIAGDRARLRRRQVAELEQRAARAEREAERERRLAAAEERTRIARELHDSAGHAINVILVQAGAARLLQERDPEGSRRAINTIEQVARDTIGEIDRMVRALRTDDAAEPSPADPAAFEELLARHRASGLDIDADVPGNRPALPRSVAWAGYRILQEALTNAARHGTGRARVSVVFQPREVQITVTNPTAGDGSTSRQGPREGHGIVGMRERAMLLGGTLETSATNGTFRLHARLPHGEVTS